MSFLEGSSLARNIILGALCVPAALLVYSMRKEIGAAALGSLAVVEKTFFRKLNDVLGYPVENS